MAELDMALNELEACFAGHPVRKLFFIPDDEQAVYVRQEIRYNHHTVTVTVFDTLVARVPIEIYRQLIGEEYALPKKMRKSYVPNDD